MSQLPYWMVAAWFGGAVILVAMSLNDTRLILNNLAPGEKYYGELRFSFFGIGWRLDATTLFPSQLNDIGKLHLKRAIRNKRIMTIWIVGGFILNVCLFSYLKDS